VIIRMTIIMLAIAVELIVLVEWYSP